ncbi:hypothetical protein [Aminobacter aminovorans]|uniref:hypothetical protein n=1 Tax=Aminobacter aminovorans TaxID=83263 RepID=UPI00285AAC07|nr:hypothetical protein [Aminobacter aminovorans]MDR7221506.1 hypothetical protein [Aminobacter aminovorans]
MRFRLTYDGELRARQRKPESGQFDKLAGHKHQLRKVFHHQLKQQWANDWFLSSANTHPSEHDLSQLGADSAARWAASPNGLVPLHEIVAERHRAYGYRFVPLVRREWMLLCSLNILLLRHDPPGSAISAGDLDNRIKTLIDGLRPPSNQAELPDNAEPAPDEDPFYCLLEDDNLVTSMTVETDRLLEPIASNRDEDRRRVKAIITVDVRPYAVTMFNMSFA